MAELSDVRDLFYGVLQTFADAQTPALLVFIKGGEDPATGKEYEAPNDAEYLRWNIVTRKPGAHFAGRGHISNEGGIFQVDVMGPEDRLQKHYESLAFSLRRAYWPDTTTSKAPTLGTDPLVRLLAPPHIRDHPSPDKGELGSIMTIDWASDFPRA